MKQSKFTYVGPVNNTGYGVASIGYANAITRENPDVVVVPIGQVGNHQELSEASRKALTKTPDYSKPVFCFWHLHDVPNQLQEFTGPKVVLSTFEVDTLSGEELYDLPKYQAIGTTTEWGRSILKRHSQLPAEKIFICPHAFRQDSNQKLDRYNFDIDFVANWQKIVSPYRIDPNSLVLTTAGKFELRKGYPELVEATIELSKIKPIVLVTFCHNPFIQDGFPYSFINSNFFYPIYTDSGIKVFKKHNLIWIVMPPTGSRMQLHAALSKGHFFISPSKGEGWNLPLFEMMSYGMPCITSLVSAHTEYCDETNIIPVADMGLKDAIDPPFFKGIGKWYNITKENVLVALSIATSKTIDELKIISDNAYKSTETFTWEKSGKVIQKLMNQF